ncbi:MAG: thiazole biosynthesis protein [Candidatus Omnitrophica bacterium]|nr:thiazole biosynthesis protein [Candidatus Omnitrophota bacterium]
MKIDDITVSRAIIETYTQRLLNNLDVDVAIVGGGPAGLCAGYYLAKKKYKVAMFEKKLSIGGGMWGGGIMFNQIVVQAEGKEIMDEMEIRTVRYRPGYYTADAIETVAVLISKAVKAGLQVFNLMSAEDIMVRKDRVVGLVINWSPVDLAGLHVDPIATQAKCVIDATGHPSEIARLLRDKQGVKLLTKTGKVMGEKSMWAEMGEKAIMSNTKKIYPGLYVAGMAANAVFGGQRMGPIFGGMLLSGRKVSRLIDSDLRREKNV